LGSLRPYRGYLVEEHYHEIMRALRVLAPTLQGPTVDREVMSSLWSLVFCGEAWALDAGQPVNGLMGEAEQRRLQGWVRTLQFTVHSLLQNIAVKESFWDYDNGRVWGRLNQILVDAVVEYRSVLENRFDIPPAVQYSQNKHILTFNAIED
jgi:hypothetical protein